MMLAVQVRCRVLPLSLGLGAHHRTANYVSRCRFRGPRGLFLTLLHVNWVDREHHTTSYFTTIKEFHTPVENSCVPLWPWHIMKPYANALQAHRSDRLTRGTAFIALVIYTYQIQDRPMRGIMSKHGKCVIPRGHLLFDHQCIHLR